MEGGRPRFGHRFLALWLAGVGATVLVLPYAFTLQRAALESVPLPLPVVALASVLQTAVLLAVAVFVGLRAADAVGLRTPLTDALVTRAGVGAAWRALRPASAVMVGAVVGGLILGLEHLVFRPLLPDFAAAAGASEVTRAQGFLASFYGGIAEELLTRLFLVSALAWLLRGRATWLAIVVAALVFGAGHLPAVATLAPLTPLLVARTLVLNALGGVAFGWLSWRRGLEAGMVAHFAADLVLHVIATV